ncbi:hypothetical protein WJX72_010811 [[Myrmecia] bisecta]|uniref:Eukaryotic translation initiation factor 3 subunit B n=1 Tax=[Myrmecia] bisecta TaxID=41462 RepID=A0AAW1QSP4_9CHLO
MLPEDDDMGIESEDDEIAEEEIQTESGFGSVIVVDNLPCVSPEKYEKLLGVVTRLFSRVGTIREGGLWMPTDPETKDSLGFAFIEFLTPAEAHAAREQTNGYKLDKSHTFVVNMFDDFEKYLKVTDEYQPPAPKEYVPTDNLLEWMMDRRGRDQFVVRYGDETEVHWHDAARRQPEEVYKRTFWTESFVQWSPRGTYLATVHRQGVAVWGGPKFVRLMRFSHPGCVLIDFSPCEKYLISYSSQEPNNPREKASLTLNIFDIRNGKKLRNFTGGTEDFAVGAAAGPGGSLKWPVFKWAGGCDDKYFARLGKNAISVYETPDMGLLDKKSLKLDGVHDFAWSPAEPILCAYQTEQSGGNLPARISLVRMPDRQELRQKNLFSVSDVKMFWHPQGDYLAVRVERYTKTRKSTYSAFELFSLKERDIPMEILELPDKSEKIIDFQWEPRGNRFAILHGDGPRPTFSLYCMKDLKTTARGVQLIGTLPNKQANCMSWSPQGKFLILGGLKALNGQLEFFNADDFETLNAAEHFMCTDIDWDPTGRYVATSVTSIHQMENGYNIWLFNGELLYRTPKERFYQYLWRPRQPTLLTPEQERDILKNLKQRTKRFEEEDEALALESDAGLVAMRKKLMKDWEDWLESKREWIEQNEATRRAILGDRLQEGEFTVEQVEVEDKLGTTEELIAA